MRGKRGSYVGRPTTDEASYFPVLLLISSACASADLKMRCISLSKRKVSPVWSLGCHSKPTSPDCPASDACLAHPLKSKGCRGLLADSQGSPQPEIEKAWLHTGVADPACVTPRWQSQPCDWLHDSTLSHPPDRYNAQPEAAAKIYYNIIIGAVINSVSVLLVRHYYDCAIMHDDQINLDSLFVRSSQKYLEMQETVSAKRAVHLLNNGLMLYLD